MNVLCLITTPMPPNAELSGATGNIWPLGYGLDFEAVLFSYRVKFDFETKELEKKLHPEIAALGADIAYYKVGGFLLTHEVLHAVGAKHENESRFVMTKKPLWEWILSWPIISQESVNRVKKKLDVKP
jgi:hypothetical protein